MRPHPLHHDTLTVLQKNTETGKSGGWVRNVYQALLFLSFLEGPGCMYIHVGSAVTPFRVLCSMVYVVLVLYCLYSLVL